MEHLRFSEVEFNTTDYEIRANTLLAEFLKAFLRLKKTKIEQLEASYENFKKLKEDLQATKEKTLLEICTITHGRMLDAALWQRFSGRIQTELYKFLTRLQEVVELSEKMQRNYKGFRGTVEEQMRNWPDDKLYEMFQCEVEGKIVIWKKDAKTSDTKYKAIESATQENISGLETELQTLQKDVDMLKPLKAEMGEALQRLKEDLKERKLKYQDEINLLMQDVTTMKKRRQYLPNTN